MSSLALPEILSNLPPEKLQPATFQEGEVSSLRRREWI